MDAPRRFADFVPPSGISNVLENQGNFFAVDWSIPHTIEEVDMTFGRGALLWLIGIPLPIIILLALFWH